MRSFECSSQGIRSSSSVLAREPKQFRSVKVRVHPRSLHKLLNLHRILWASIWQAQKLRPDGWSNIGNVAYSHFSPPRKIVRRRSQQLKSSCNFLCFMCRYSALPWLELPIHKYVFSRLLLSKQFAFNTDERAIRPEQIRTAL